MKRWRRWSRRRRVVMVLLLVFVLLVPLPLAAYAVSLRLQYTGDPSASARTRNQDQPGKNPGMDLDDPAVRDRVTTSSAAVLDQGFRGIHFDFEPVHSGSAGFLAVLDRVHVLTARRGVPLSVAAAQIDPIFRVNDLVIAITGEGKWWSQQYFGEVARRVEQIAVMSYDTAMPLKSLYGGYVAKQTEPAIEVTRRTSIC